MDDLTNQLRQLGEATEAATTRVTAGQITSQHVGPDDMGLDLDHAVVADVKPSTDRRRSGVLLAAAAALIVLAAGSAIFLDRTDDTQASLETASAQTDSASDFAVPEDDNGWEAVRSCESTGNYQVDTGNTFYGAYQFTREYFQRTAERLELDDYLHMNPAKAPPEIQDALANAIYLERGSDSWPVCGRHFTGAQVTPVVPQWIGQLGRRDHNVLVFLNPELSEEQITNVRSDIVQILEDAADSRSMDYVDQQQAYDEFQRMFDGDEQIAQSVSVQAMPASFRVRDRVNPRQIELLRRLEGVFNVIEPDASIRFDPAPPMKISIPAIQLSAPVYPSASTESLAKGAVVLGGNAVAPAIAGYGSVDGSVFARIDELRDGDLIEVSYLLPREEDLAAPPVGTQVIRTYRVIGVGSDGPEPVEVDDLPAWSEAERHGLTLVADVGGDALLRVIIETEITDPETSGYGIEDDS